MTPAETLILASYFFVLIILAVYGWHRYYLVYLYMRHRENGPKATGQLDPFPVVTIQLPNCAEFAYVFFAAERLGAVANQIGPDFRSREVEYIIRFSGSRAYVCPARFKGFDHVAMIDELRPRLPDLKLVLVLGGEDRAGVLQRAGVGVARDHKRVGVHGPRRERVVGIDLERGCVAVRAPVAALRVHRRHGLPAPGVPGAEGLGGVLPGDAGGAAREGLAGDGPVELAGERVQDGRRACRAR